MGGEKQCPFRFEGDRPLERMVCANVKDDNIMYGQKGRCDGLCNVKNDNLHMDKRGGRAGGCLYIKYDTW